jgi:hypothetical protein
MAPSPIFLPTIEEAQCSTDQGQWVGGGERKCFPCPPVSEKRVVVVQLLGFGVISVQCRIACRLLVGTK